MNVPSVTAAAPINVPGATAQTITQTWDPAQSTRPSFALGSPWAYLVSTAPARRQLGGRQGELRDARIRPAVRLVLDAVGFAKIFAAH